MRYVLRFSALLSCIVVLTVVRTSAVAQDTTPLRVAIKPLTPFVIYNDDGTFSSFSIDLWEAIAERNTWGFEYVPLETVADVLEMVRTGDADVGIAGISITREREETLDFSQPMFNAGLQIMTNTNGSAPGLDLLLRFFSPSLLLVFIVLFVVIILVGHLVWLVEHKKPEFPDDYLPGKRIVTVADTTSAAFLQERNLLFSTVTTIEEAYPLLESRRADAIVYDAPVLRYTGACDDRGQPFSPVRTTALPCSRTDRCAR
ncbi:MAG: transporter substrate-binding domain-containing protein [Chloroflexota bacterium]|nr:transporter substrate-binding domain-containing protein [Chloroflexota bacterium]